MAREGIEAAIKRSKVFLDGSEEKIVSKYNNEAIVYVQQSSKLKVRPIWTLPGDNEGQMYAEYRQEHPKYDQVYVRKSVYTRLVDAARNLPENIQLVVHAGHRPLEIQKKLLLDYAYEFQKSHPAASGDEALNHARLYVADPSLRLPAHCLGAAVDVQLFNHQANSYLDMGSPLNFGEEISHIHSTQITEQQYENRMTLLHAMLEAGFASYPNEWWHFSYGDQVWAWFYGEEESLYGLVDIPGVN